MVGLTYHRMSVGYTIRKKRNWFNETDSVLFISIWIYLEYSAFMILIRELLYLHKVNMTASAVIMNCNSLHVYAPCPGRVVEGLEPADLGPHIGEQHWHIDLLQAI